MVSTVFLKLKKIMKIRINDGNLRFGFSSTFRHSLRVIIIFKLFPTTLLLQDFFLVFKIFFCLFLASKNWLPEFKISFNLIITSRIFFLAFLNFSFLLLAFNCYFLTSRAFFPAHF